MKLLRRETIAEQTAAHLRDAFHAGRWRGHLPGVARLAAELDVSRDSVRTALKLLESEGVLKDRGAGKRRQIVSPHRHPTKRRTLRIAILLNLPLAQDNSHSQQIFLLMKQAIESSGHVCFFAERTLSELGDKPARIARLVRVAKADAWIVYAATHEVLAWFAARKTPTLAVGGRAQGLPIAGTGTDIRSAIAASVDALASHGHRRIVMIAPPFWGRPYPARNATAFFARLKHHLIVTSEYNLPDWDKTPEGLQKLLDSLFSVTPPTALLISEPVFCAGTLTFLNQRKLQIPRDVSIVCMLSDPVFSMCRPVIAHFDWPLATHVRRARRWAEAVAFGHKDLRQEECTATFVPGGTIGPVKK